MQDIAISADALTRRFGDLTAVRDFSFEVFEGEVFGCLGHNGAGKTTSIRLLNGVLEASSGSARVLGLDPPAQGSQLRRRTGVLTENPSLDERLTARENLTFYAEVYGVDPEKVKPRVDELLERFQLAERADEKTGGYSKGMKQRLALARALIHEPELLFLDEPTAGLDPFAARQVRELIASLSEAGRTIFLCTHNLVEAQRLCDRIAVLEHGELLALGSLDDLGRRLGREQWIELETEAESQAKAIEILRGEFGIVSVEVSHATLTFKGIDREGVPDMVAALAQRGVRLFRVVALEPTLEDVYFSLHRHDDEGTSS